jgi:hypothetical protein
VSALLAVDCGRLCGVAAWKAARDALNLLATDPAVPTRRRGAPGDEAELAPFALGDSSMVEQRTLTPLI